jgi:hypothetical protein
MKEKSWKIENPAVFFVGGFLAQIKDGPLFFAKNSHYVNFREIEEGQADRVNITLEIVDIKKKY